MRTLAIRVCLYCRLTMASAGDKHKFETNIKLTNGFMAPQSRMAV